MGSDLMILLEGGLDAAHRGFQIGANALHDCDDGDRDASGDEAIFDGSRSGLVLGKALYEVRHIELHWSTRGCLSVTPEPFVSWLSGSTRGP